MKNLLLLCLAVCFLSSCGGSECAGDAASCRAAQQAAKQAELFDGEYGQCAVPQQKRFVREHLDDVYLWYAEINHIPAEAFSNAEDYFKALLVTKKDRFSFSQAQTQVTNFFQAGEEIGYGFNYIVEDNKILISYIDPNSPAEKAKIVRGAEILAIDGTPILQLARKVRNDALFPKEIEESHQFEILPRGAKESRQLSLTSKVVFKHAVQISKVIDDAGRKFGYLQFNQHNIPAEGELLFAMLQFRNAGIQDLIVDMRYNRGGYLFVASEMAAMIAGPQVDGKIFEKLLYSDKHLQKTYAAASTMVFPQTSRDKTFPLPRLNLPRVFVLTGPDTCSASEAIINGLAPFMEVILIGNKTCGKPYGFTQRNFCGSSYFAIEFTGVNDKGFGDYANGFKPTCFVADDYEHALGEKEERLLATALNYAKTGACSRTVARAPAKGAAPSNQPSLPPPHLLDPLDPLDPLDQDWRNQRLLN